MAFATHTPRKFPGPSATQAKRKRSAWHSQNYMFSVGNFYYFIESGSVAFSFGKQELPLSIGNFYLFWDSNYMASVHALNLRGLVAIPPPPPRINPMACCHPHQCVTIPHQHPHSSLQIVTAKLMTENRRALPSPRDMWNCWFWNSRLSHSAVRCAHS